MSGRSSPRPGVATCKFKPRKVKILGYNSGNNLISNNKNNMLNGRFITRPSRVEETVKTVAEKKNSKNTNMLVETISETPEEKNVIIEEISSKKSSQLMIDEMVRKNELIKRQISITGNPIMKQLYKHEIRLNIQDINIECLNDIKCSEALNNQKEFEISKVLDEVTENLNSLKNDLQMCTVKQKDTTNNYKKFYGDYKFKIDEIQDSICMVTDHIGDLKEFKNNTENNLNEKEHKIQNLIEYNQQLNEKNNELKIKIRILKDTIIRICDKLCSDKSPVDAWDIKNDIETLEI